MANQDPNISSPTDFNTLNELGCVDEMNARLTKLQGIIGSLSASNEQLDRNILNATLWCASDLLDECVEIKNRTSALLPSRVG